MSNPIWKVVTAEEQEENLDAAAVEESIGLMSHDIWKGLLYVWRKSKDTFNPYYLFPNVKQRQFFKVTDLSMLHSQMCLNV
ncbi:hypothetical protein AOLI_G00286250 [Acnodon oligacanthus]